MYVRKKINVGDTVYWKWGNGMAEAEVMEIRQEKTTIETKGKTISRDGSPEDPALILLNARNVRILKLSHEVEPDK